MSRFELTRAALQRALDGALQYLQGLERTAVAPKEGRSTLRNRFIKPLRRKGASPEKVVTDLISDCDGSIVGSSTGRFFGWAVGGTLPAALAADWLVSAWDQNAVLYACAPAAAQVEEVVGSWLKDLLNLPQRASFALTTGCQMAHVTCLAAARNRLLAKLGWDVERNGLRGAPLIRIFANDQRHGSIERAARLLGLGTEHILAVATDTDGRVLVNVLEQALRAHEPAGSAIVILQAGDFHTGAFDNFRALISIAHRYGAWVHVDGAFGLWAAASPLYRHLTEALNTADSWAVDGHKWLNVPFDCGYAFVADSEAHRNAISHRASYLTHDREARDQIDWNPEWSRRARGFPTYAALRQLGRDGVVDLIERSCLHASALVSRIGSMPGAEILAKPIINQGLVRFVAGRPDASEEDHDRKTEEVIRSVNASGEAFFTASTWHGRRVMRVSVCNWRTTEADIDRAVAAFQKVLT
ncbi:MAG: aspartate aminotransferase family protein [Acidobacteria bacterium]|nr:aspartate aminotransferase family protein [Acidobacteriota bacterium]